MFCRLAACFALLALPALAAPPGIVKTFGNWTVTCNNVGTCALMGSTGDEAPALVYLKLTRDAGERAVPQIKLVAALPDKPAKTPPPATFGLIAVSGKDKAALAPLPAKASADDPQYIAGTSEGPAVVTLIQAVRNADRLEVTWGKLEAAIDLKGFSAALRFFDDRQGRAGSPAALIATGMTPPSAVPPPVALPVVAGAAPGSVQAVATPIASKALLAAPPADDCDAETVSAHEGLAAWSTGPDSVLVQIPCTNGAYNFTSLFYLTDRAGGHVTPAALPRPAGTAADQPKNAVVNGDFDPKTMQLSEFDKGRGIGDCGTLTQWIWTGQAFVLLSADVEESCPGALPQDWPNVYTAVRK